MRARTGCPSRSAGLKWRRSAAARAGASNGVPVPSAISALDAVPSVSTVTKSTTVRSAGGAPAGVGRSSPSTSRGGVAGWARAGAARASATSAPASGTPNEKKDTTIPLRRTCKEARRFMASGHDRYRCAARGEHMRRME
jgi:hypothetical protein